MPNIKDMGFSCLQSEIITFLSFTSTFAISNYFSSSNSATVGILIHHYSYTLGCGFWWILQACRSSPLKGLLALAFTWKTHYNWWFYWKGVKTLAPQRKCSSKASKTSMITAALHTMLILTQLCLIQVFTSDISFAIW